MRMLSARILARKRLKTLRHKTTPEVVRKMELKLTKASEI